MIALLGLLGCSHPTPPVAPAPPVVVEAAPVEPAIGAPAVPEPAATTADRATPEPPHPAGLPDPYVDKGVCPGECCTYREWQATGGVDVMDAPRGIAIVATLSRGEALTALTGEVHTSPIWARVTQARTLPRAPPDETAAPRTVQPGELIWLLEGIGEGYARIWVDGHVYQDEALFWLSDGCENKIDETCWASTAPNADNHEAWWVKVKTKSGVVGWVDNTRDVLTGFDSCG